MAVALATRAEELADRLVLMFVDNEVAEAASAEGYSVAGGVSQAGGGGVDGSGPAGAQLWVERAPSATHPVGSSSRGG